MPFNLPSHSQFDKICDTACDIYGQRHTWNTSKFDQITDLCLYCK